MAHQQCHEGHGCNGNNKCPCPCGPCRVGVDSALADEVAQLKGALEVVKEKLKNHLSAAEITQLETAINLIGV